MSRFSDTVNDQVPYEFGEVDGIDVIWLRVPYATSFPSSAASSAVT